MSGSRREVVREVYSEVLFDLAQQSCELESVLEELMAVRGVFKAEPEFAALLSSQIVKGPEKAEIVRRVFSGRLSELTVNFLSVLSRRGRMSFLGGVSEKFEMLVDAHQNRSAVEVTISSKPDDEQIMKLKADIVAALDSKVKLSIKVDPKIIGGVIIKKDDMLVDNSVRTALNRTIQAVMENMKSQKGRQVQ